MSERSSLTLFAHLCARPEAELDLAEAALLIAEAEAPGLDVAHYVHALDALGESARAAVARASGDEARITRAVRYVYEDAGFRGNDGDYYDPRNSFLNEVIDRRTGIPITLAIVLVEVSRRAGIQARGVSFPGHFLVRFDTPRGTIVVDPFVGRPVSREELRALYHRGSGEDRDPPAGMLDPATKAQILARVLNNLRTIYEDRKDDARLRAVVERLQVLARNEGSQRRKAPFGHAPPRPGGGGLN
jgi:regulator of sirC expression with transglutaminase-like and TPR domain